MSTGRRMDVARAPCKSSVKCLILGRKLPMHRPTDVGAFGRSVVVGLPETGAVPAGGNGFFQIDHGGRGAGFGSHGASRAGEYDFAAGRRRRRSAGLMAPVGVLERLFVRLHLFFLSHVLNGLGRFILGRLCSLRFLARRGLLGIVVGAHYSI